MGRETPNLVFPNRWQRPSKVHELPEDGYRGGAVASKGKGKT